MGMSQAVSCNLGPGEHCLDTELRQPRSGSTLSWEWCHSQDSSRGATSNPILDGVNILNLTTHLKDNFSVKLQFEEYLVSWYIKLTDIQTQAVFQKKYSRKLTKHKYFCLTYEILMWRHSIKKDDGFIFLYFLHKIYTFDSISAFSNTYGKP